MRFQATSLQEKFKFKFFPTRKLQASSNLSSNNVNILKTVIQNNKLLNNHRLHVNIIHVKN